MGKMSLTSCRALSTPGKFSNVDRYAHWFQRYRLGQTVTTIGRHLESAIQTELVVEPDIPLIKRKQSGRFE